MIAVTVEVPKGAVRVALVALSPLQSERACPQAMANLLQLQHSKGQAPTLIPVTLTLIGGPILLRVGRRKR